MKIAREDIKDLSQKKLIFFLIDAEGKINNKNLECIEDVTGASYLKAVFSDDKIKKEPNAVELSYDIYIRIIMSSDVNGIAIDIKDEILYVIRCDLRWFMIKSEEEKYVKDDKDLEKMYYHHLQNIRYLWLDKKYKDIEDYLSLINEKYSRYASELNFYYGKIYETMGYGDRAELFYRNAIKLEGDNIWLFYQLALFYARGGDKDKEWNTCKIAYKQFAYLCNEIVYNEFIEKIVNMMLENEKCGWLDKKVYSGFIRRIRSASQQLECNLYLVLD